MLMKNGFSHFEFSEAEIKIGFAGGKIAKHEQNSLIKMHRILRYAKSKRNFKRIKEKTKGLKHGMICECEGTMHWQKERPSNIGLKITHEVYTRPNSTINFEIDIKNTMFERLSVVCSVKNLAYMEFVDLEMLKPNSLGDLLISAQRNIDVTVVFDLIDTNNEQKLLLGAPLVIYTGK